jgi:hypothetical protein
MIEEKKIKQLCEKYFSFLENDYSFRLVSVNEENWGSEIKFKSLSVGVTLTFEFREFYLFVRICKLKNEEFPVRPGELGPNTVLEEFDLDDIVSIRSREALLPQYGLDTKFNDEFLETIIKKQSENLKLFASDILEGDFSLFPELDSKVKDRARKAAINKWGKRAAEFGWKV